MRLDVLYQGRLYLLKTGYDERYASFSPGHLLYLEMIKRSCEDGIAAHELLGPTTPFKERYATETRQTSVLRAYRRRPAGVARYGGRRFVLPRVRPAYERVHGSLKR
jgi:CelD/BcsL family acetyltransferase involved in cellulose biosynthesis